MADVKIGLGSYTETAVASATTCDIGAATTLRVRITGTVTITSFGTAANRIRFVRFADALTLTHNGTTLQLPTDANIITATGDACMAVSDNSGNWIVLHYHRKSGAPLAFAGVNTQTASYTLALTDNGKVVEMNVGGANDLTVPLSSSVLFPIGSRIDIAQIGAGQTTIVEMSGVTIQQRESKLKLAGQYARASLYKRATDEWLLSGDLSA